MLDRVKLSRVLKLVLCSFTLCAGTALAQRGVAYAWVFDASAASVSPTYSLNPSGQTITATHNGTGNYTVSFPGSGIGTGWDLQIIAYGGDTNYCKTGSWGGDAVNVLCFNTAGAAADARFTVLAIANNNDKNIAFAWADQPSTSSYSPDSSYAYNPTGGITITRSSVGSYSVNFANQNLNGGTVQITSYGSGNSNCYSGGWGGTFANVECQNASGAAVDSYFVIAIIPAGVSPSGLAFTWANNSTASSYTPVSTYTYNPGGPVSITRNGPGNYNVTFTGIDTAEISGGDVRATAYGTTNRCKVFSWGSGGGSDIVANVGCYNISGTPSDSVYEVLVIAPSAGLGFYPVTPCRVVDTRFSSGLPAPFGPPSMTAGQTRSFPIPLTSCGIPATALAYSLNVTVVPPAPLTYLSIWPTGQPQPIVSTLNSFDGQVVANAAIVPAGSSGAISVFVSDNTDVIIDIDGYFGPPSVSALAFYRLEPCRVADTRSAAGFIPPFGPPSLSAGATRSFPVKSSSCGIPSAALAYSLNMTVVPPGPLTYLSVWPAGLPQPVVSTLNSFNGRIVANAAIVPAGSGGAIDVYASDNTDLIIDIDGYFAPPGLGGELYLYTVTPCRIADTRSVSGFPSPFGPPSLTGDSTRSFPIQLSSCGVPGTSQAYSLNMTVVPPGPLAYLTTWPTGQPQPIVSTLNALNGTVVANAALVPAGALNGSISVFVTNNTDLLIDINAYFAP